MAFQSLGPPSDALDPIKTTVDDVDRRIFRHDVIPSITNVANWIRLREDLAAKGKDPVGGEAATKMLGIWDEVYGYCQLELILVLLDVTFRQKTTVCGAFLS